MEEIIKNKDIAYILYFVTEKYQNYKSDKKEVNTKLTYFKEKITKDDFFRKYSYYYIDKHNLSVTPEDLADDILNIAVILSDKISFKEPEKIINIKEENMELYLLLVRNRSCKEILTLNKLILDNDTIEKIRDSKIYFTKEEEYLNYIESLLSQKYFRYWILEKNDISCNVAIDKVKKELYTELNDLKKELENKNKHMIRQYQKL